MMRVHQVRFLRQFMLPLLARFGDRDITIKHAWHPEQQVRVNLYRHKGYWFHRKTREMDLMRSLDRLLYPGAQVVEVGCHVGWISLHLSKLVGEEGKLFAFEPSPNNLPYLRKNVSSSRNVEIVEKAVSNEVGEATFFVEPLTGQNDTLIQDYEVFAKNKKNAFSEATYEKIQVKTVSLDEFFAKKSSPIALVKIDVEGAERLVLEGSAAFIDRFRPVIVLEVTREFEWVEDFFREKGYARYDESLSRAREEPLSSGNWIFAPSEREMPSDLS